MHTPFMHRLMAGGVLVAALASCAACSSSSSADGDHSATAAGKVATDLPAALQESKVLRVGTNIPFVPMEMYASDGTTFEGIDIDLITAVGARLGLKVQVSNAAWDGLIPSLKAGRYDVLAASFGDFVERQKVVDMVDMLNGNIAAISLKGAAGSFTDPMSLCGKRVAVENGSATVQVAASVSTTCTAAGKSAITQSVFPTDANSIVALQSGRVDIVLDDMVVAQHIAATQSAEYSMVLPDLGKGFLYGFVVNKGNTKLATSLQGAVNSLIADGTYAKICARYGITGESLLKKATINAGTTSANDA